MFSLTKRLPERPFLASDFIQYKTCPICDSSLIERIGNEATIHPRSRFNVALMLCLNCEHWYTDPMPTPRLLASLYGESSLSVLGESWSEAVEISNADTSISRDSHWVVESLRKTEPGNFLEIGPGDGSLLRKMRALGWNSFGVDLGDYAKGFQVVSSPEQLPSSILFDAIIFQDVLEHVSNPYDVLRDYLPYLSSKAVLLMAVPWSESKRARRFRTSWEMVRPLGHLHYFSKSSARAVLESNGFEPLRFQIVNIYGSYFKSLVMSLAKLAYCIMRPSRWNTVNLRVRRVVGHVSIFPGDPIGDQLYVMAQRKIL
jgi:hypothetical protein